MEKIPHLTKKQSAGLDVKLGSYPPENILGHPVIRKSTISATLLIGTMVAVVAWLLSAGVFVNEEPLKLYEINTLVITFIGFLAGSAVGGLIGIVYGIFMMLKEKW